MLTAQSRAAAKYAGDLEADYGDRLEGNHTANKHSQSAHDAEMMPRSKNSIYGSRNIISLFS